MEMCIRDRKKAAALENVALEISVKVSATGVTYGSVTAATVAEELEKKGFAVDRKIITMRDIKKVGEYEATIPVSYTHLHEVIVASVGIQPFLFGWNLALLNGCNVGL